MRAYIPGYVFFFFLLYLVKKDKLAWKCDPIETAVLKKYPEQDAEDNVNEIKDNSKSHLESLTTPQKVRYQHYS